MLALGSFNMRVDVPLLKDQVASRCLAGAAAEAMSRLGIDGNCPFWAFYLRYPGPHCSSTTGFEMLALVDDQLPSVESSTVVVRSQFAWSERFIVFSNLLAGSVLVYETTTDLVYDVDFEGGDALLVNGILKASFPSFCAFLCFYFGEATISS